MLHKPLYNIMQHNDDSGCYIRLLVHVVKLEPACYCNMHLFVSSLQVICAQNAGITCAASMSSYCA